MFSKLLCATHATQRTHGLRRNQKPKYTTHACTQKKTQRTQSILFFALRFSCPYIACIASVALRTTAWQGFKWLRNGGGMVSSPPFLFPPFPFPLLPLPSLFTLPFLHLPFPSLRSRPPEIQLGGLGGGRCELPQRGLGRAPAEIEFGVF